MKLKCPHCGNTKLEHIQDNGVKPGHPDYTVLCVAPIAEGELDSFDREVGAPKTGRIEDDSDGECGMQWEPNSGDYDADED